MGVGVDVGVSGLGLEGLEWARHHVCWCGCKPYVAIDWRSLRRRMGVVLYVLVCPHRTHTRHHTHPLPQRLPVHCNAGRPGWTPDPAHPVQYPVQAWVLLEAWAAGAGHPSGTCLPGGPQVGTATEPPPFPRLPAVAAARSSARTMHCIKTAAPWSPAASTAVAAARSSARTTPCIRTAAPWSPAASTAVAAARSSARTMHCIKTAAPWSPAACAAERHQRHAGPLPVPDLLAVAAERGGARPHGAHAEAHPAVEEQGEAGDD